MAQRKDWELTHISYTAGIARHVKTESAVAPFPPRPAFNLGLCMSNLTNLAIAVQFTTETSTRPLHMLEIAQIALKERVKKWAAIITKPQPEPVVLFQAKCSIITAWKCLHRWSNLFPVCNYKDCLPVPYTVTLGENHNTLFFVLFFSLEKCLNCTDLLDTIFYFYFFKKKGKQEL